MEEDTEDQELADLIHEFHDDACQGDAEKWAEAETYCNRVLHHDLRKARARPGQRHPDHADVLVLLCGLSQAPLLLATAWLRPGRIVLVGSDTEPGPAETTEMERHLQVGRFPEVTGLRILVERGPEIPASDPAAAYRSLKEVLRPLRETHGAHRVVVDVTGGKKTMVTAAFLASSELGVRTQYVDFDEWDSSARLPRPGGSFVRELKDPAAVFRLREVEAARSAFDEERFSEAARRIEEILPDLRCGRVEGYVTEAELARLERRHAYARASEHWSQGRYDEALARFDSPPLAGVIEAPRAVRELGALLRVGAAQNKTPEVLVPSDARAAMVYVGDELWRQRRALDRQDVDPKLPFQRAYALVETVLTATLYPRRDQVRVMRKDHGGNEIEVTLMEYLKAKDPKFKKADVDVRTFGRELSSRGLAILGCGNKTEKVNDLRFTLEGAGCSIPAAEEILDQRKGWAQLRNACTHMLGTVDRKKADEFVMHVVDKIARQAMTVLGLDDLADELLGNGDADRPLRWDAVK